MVLTLFREGNGFPLWMMGLKEILYWMLTCFAVLTLPREAETRRFLWSPGRFSENATDTSTSWNNNVDMIILDLIILRLLGRPHTTSDNVSPRFWRVLPTLRRVNKALWREGTAHSPMFSCAISPRNSRDESMPRFRSA